MDRLFSFIVLYYKLLHGHGDGIRIFVNVIINDLVCARDRTRSGCEMRCVRTIEISLYSTSMRAATDTSRNSNCRHSVTKVKDQCR